MDALAKEMIKDVSQDTKADAYKIKAFNLFRPVSR